MTDKISTKTVKERLAVIETKISSISDDIEEIKKELKNTTEVSEFTSLKETLIKSLNQINNAIEEINSKTQEQIQALNTQHKLLSQSFTEYVNENKEKESKYRNIITVLIPIAITTATTAIIEAISLFKIHF